MPSLFRTWFPSTVSCVTSTVTHPSWPVTCPHGAPGPPLKRLVSSWTFSSAHGGISSASFWLFNHRRGKVCILRKNIFSNFTGLVFFLFLMHSPYFSQIVCKCLGLLSGLLTYLSVSYYITLIKHLIALLILQRKLSLLLPVL